MSDLGSGRAFSQFPRSLTAERTARTESAVDGSGSADAAGKAPRTEKPEQAASTPTYQAAISELQQIDRRVRAHEMAHLLSGDGVVRGGASFTYTRGPDGKNYAVGGEVPIDASPGRTPQETLDKARAIERAALAPVDPSPQDRRVAALAQQMAAEASLELAQQKREALGGGSRHAMAVNFYQRVAEADGSARVAAGLLAVA